MHWRAIARVDRFNKGVLQCKSMPYCIFVDSIYVRVLFVLSK